MSRAEEDIFFSLHTSGDISGKMINHSKKQKTLWERAAFNQKLLRVDRIPESDPTDMYVCTLGCTVYTRHTQIPHQHQNPVWGWEIEIEQQSSSFCTNPHLEPKRKD